MGPCATNRRALPLATLWPLQQQYCEDDSGGAAQQFVSDASVQERQCQWNQPARRNQHTGPCAHDAMHTEHNWQGEQSYIVVDTYGNAISARAVLAANQTSLSR